MERTNWLDGGLDSDESRFLMVTAKTHHGFTSAVWGEHEIRKLYAELAEMEASAAGVLAAMRTSPPGIIVICGRLSPQGVGKVRAGVI
jgi:hypothetical protein